MNNNSIRHRVGVVGFRGYSGVELVRLLGRHPSVELFLLEHRSDSEQRPVPLGHKPPTTIAATPDAIKQEGLDLVFLATPPEVSIELTPAILAAGTKVIDFCS